MKKNHHFNEKLIIIYYHNNLYCRDNGDALNPYSDVTLDYDVTFNVTSPEAQQWLLDFCRALRSTHMYQRSSGPQLTNCFIENFKVNNPLYAA